MKTIDESLIKFNEQYHVYYYDEKKITNSVTKILNKYFPKFDMEKMSKFCEYKGKYLLYSANEIKQIWENVGNDASNFGTNVHYFLECLLKNEKAPIPKNKREQEFFLVAYDYIVNQFNENFEVLELEKKIVWPDRDLAGMIDCVAKEKSTGKLFLIDWKTSEGRLDESKGGLGLPPITHLDDSKLSKYELQLNFYKAMILSNKYYDVNDIELLVVQITESQCIEYQVRNLLKDVVNILLNEKGK